ncbi:MAG: hypothetical protein HY300_21085 [Verrucomicrobia bacterium]|nr:hypothetical protein [Verrucomicrobiota bacterium]
MRRTSALFLIAAVLLAGCFTVEDARHGPVFCEVHKKWMRCEMQPQVTDSPPLPSREYAEAIVKLFPHAGPEPDLERSHWRSVKIVVCDDCTRARAEWKDKQLSAGNRP